MDGDRPASTPATPKTPELSSASAPDALGLTGDVAAEFRLEMPVELWFGDHHVGVKAGSATCAEFQRFANAILSDYHTATHAQK